MALGIGFDGKFWIPRLPSLRYGRFTLDAAYAANGYAITPANLLFKARISNIILGNAKGFAMHWDHANSKLMAFKTGGAINTIFTEAANNEAGLNGLIIPFLAWGS